MKIIIFRPSTASEYEKDKLRNCFLDVGYTAKPFKMFPGWLIILLVFLSTLSMFLYTVMGVLLYKLLISF